MPNRDDYLNDIESSLRDAFALRAPLRLADTPDFPLAFNVTLPPGAASSNGALLFRFRDLALNGAARVCVAREEGRESEERLVGVVDWEDLNLEGQYDLLAKPTPVIAMDIGGTMFDKAPGGALPAGAAAVTPLDPAQQNAMLDQARAERTRLMDHPNGVQLLGTYNEHNETYNTVFATSAAARTAWAAEGATKAMALHTHDALQTTNRATVVVNPASTQANFGPHNQSYNENAFNQQIQMAVNTIAADPNFNPFDPNAKLDPNSKYTKAALAALTFGNGVGQTGNSKTAHKPLTANDVYTSVHGGHAPTPATVDELSNIVAQGAQPGGAAAATARAYKWRVLDEEDRALVRRSLYAVAVERAERSAIVTAPLWTGACCARISGASIHIAAPLDGGTDLPEVSVELPAFEIEIDDSGWSGAAADAARDRLAEASFVRSLLRESIVGALTAQARAAFRRGDSA